MPVSGVGLLRDMGSTAHNARMYTEARNKYFIPVSMK